MEAIVSGIHAFAESNREALVKHGTKTIERPTGTVAWRMTPPAIDWGKLTKEKVVALLETIGLGRLVRVVKEPNKEAMLADTNTIAGMKGVRITQREEIIVKPANGTNIVREIKNLLKRTA